MADETTGLSPRAQALDGELLARFTRDGAVAKKSDREQAIINELAALVAQVQRNTGALAAHAGDVGKGVYEHLERNAADLEGEDRRIMDAYNTALLAVHADKQIKGLEMAVDLLMRRALGANLTPYDKQGFWQTLLGDGNGHR